MAGEGWGGRYSQRGKAGVGVSCTLCICTPGAPAALLSETQPRGIPRAPAEATGAAVRWGSLGTHGAVGERTRGVQRWARWRAGNGNHRPGVHTAAGKGLKNPAVGAKAEWSRMRYKCHLRK